MEYYVLLHGYNVPGGFSFCFWVELICNKVVAKRVANKVANKVAKRVVNKADVDKLRAAKLVEDRISSLFLSASASKSIVY